MVAARHRSRSKLRSIHRIDPRQESPRIPVLVVDGQPLPEPPFPDDLQRLPSGKQCSASRREFRSLRPSAQLKPKAPNANRNTATSVLCTYQAPRITTEQVPRDGAPTPPRLARRLLVLRPIQFFKNGGYPKRSGKGMSCWSNAKLSSSGGCAECKGLPRNHDRGRRPLQRLVS